MPDDEAAPAARDSSRTVAAGLLAWVWPGLGHLYLERRGKGLVLMGVDPRALRARAWRWTRGCSCTWASRTRWPCSSASPRWAWARPTSSPGCWASRRGR